MRACVCVCVYVRMCVCVCELCKRQMDKQWMGKCTGECVQKIDWQKEVREGCKRTNNPQNTNNVICINISFIFLIHISIWKINQNQNITLSWTVGIVP